MGHYGFSISLVGDDGDDKEDDWENYADIRRVNWQMKYQQITLFLSK